MAQAGRSRRDNPETETTAAITEGDADTAPDVELSAPPVTESEALPEPVDETPRFERDRAISSAHELTGYPPHVLAGALHDSGPDDMFTREQLDRAVRAFLERPVGAEEAT